MSLPSLAEIDAELARRRVTGLYRTDPVAFVHDCFRWDGDDGPQPYQDEILAEFYRRRRVAVRAPHAVGKSTVACWIITHAALTWEAAGEDWKIVTTASVWRQLHYLWGELHKWLRRIEWARVGRPPLDPRTELLTYKLKLPHGEAMAAASDQPETLEGAHAARLLYVYDESKLIGVRTWDAAEGALMAGDTYALAISTPGAPSGRFYDIHRRAPGLEHWWTRHITIEEALAAFERSGGRVGVNPAEVEALGRLWGPTSPVYANRVLGEFAAGDESAVIPLAWLEAAQERHRALTAAGEALGPVTAIGVDVGLEQAMTTLATRHGFVISEVTRHAVKRDEMPTMRTAGLVVIAMRGKGAPAVVDADGHGAGTYDRLKEQGLRVVGYHGDHSTEAKDRSGQLDFLNLRAAAWWHLRDLLNPESGSAVALPPDDLLTAELTAPRWEVTSTGKIKLEKKQEVVARIGRSPDSADAVVMAFALEIASGSLYTLGSTIMAIGERSSPWRSL